MTKFSGFWVKTLAVSCALALACMTSSALAVPEAKKSAKKSSTSKVPAQAATGKSTSGKNKTTLTKGKHPRKKNSKNWRRRGQQKIDGTRAEEIQQALIREHYLSGEPTGTWDAASQRAMERYQADNGWQTKTIPDSRALIKLGLGPNHDHLLNPESAMTSPIEKPSDAPANRGPNVPADPSNPPNQ
ncbi:MAG TPA: peptidoglycan-binding domain-containing protein [Terriglobales bacterium]|jgi:hypothetical protein